MHALLRRLSDIHDPAVLLVTHDIDEAILLADRIIVLDEGRFVMDLPVALPATAIDRQRHIAATRERLLHRLEPSVT